MATRTKKKTRRRWFSLRPPTAPPTDPARFDEAVDFFRAQVPMRKGAWAKLGTAARQRGFAVAGVMQADVINDVWLALDDAIANGSTFDEFKKTVTASLVSEWQGTVANPASRIEVVFRTNILHANNAGRHAQMTDPAILNRRPYWQYVDVDDGARECPICHAAHGTILRHDDPWWQTHSPPQHFQCFPCDTFVEGAFIGALKAWYSGEMVEIETNGGKRLHVTPNHPVVTVSGLTVAGALREGDQLVCQRGVVDHSSKRLTENSEDHAPTTIEQVFCALREQRGFVRRARLGPLDFYGDAERFDGDVEVVGSYGELLDRLESEHANCGGNLPLMSPDAGNVPPIAARNGDPLVGRFLATSSGGPSSSALPLNASRRDLDGLPLKPLRIGPAANIDACLNESINERGPRDGLFVGDLFHRFSRLVTSDQIVKIRKYEFSGHVYDLESVRGWIIADGIYTSNCRCRTRPLTEKQAEAMGITVEKSTVPSDPGFGAPPQERAPQFTVDLSKYPPELAALVREKMEHP